MNNTILEMDVVEAFAEYKTLCAIGDCISKQIVMESYIQEADNETTTDNVPAPDVTTFQKFKNWISRIITLIKRNTSKFSRAIQKWLTRGIMGQLYKNQDNGKKIKVPKALINYLKYIVEDDDYIKQMLTTLGINGTASVDNWINPVVKFNPSANYVSLKATLDREIKKSNPYINKLHETMHATPGPIMDEVKFDEFSKSIKALQQKSNDMSNAIKDVNKLMVEEKARITDKGKNFDHYVAAMTSLMKWLLVQSNLILELGMLVPLIGTTSENTLLSDPKIKKKIETIKENGKRLDPDFNYNNIEEYVKVENGELVIYVPPKDVHSGKQWKKLTVEGAISKLNKK